VIIRQATAQDWPLIYPIYAAIMAEGKTYAFPDGQSLEEARPWWMEEPPSQTVVAMSDGEIVGSAKMGALDHTEHGLVGLHVMFRYL
jgi:hypothetical protein